MLQCKKSFMSSNQTQPGATDIFLEFLEVAIHNVLYIRNLYPRSIYTPKKKYGVTVYQAIHPEVVQYISECLKAAEFHARKNQLKKVFLCFELDGHILETFVFDLLQMQGKFINDTFLVELESALKTFMLKLHSCQVYLQDIENPESTFSIQLETINVSSIEFNENPSYQDFLWIERDPITTSDTSIVPLHSIQTDFLILQTYIEK